MSKTKRLPKKSSGISSLMEQAENCLHPITEELKRRQTIIGEHYIDHKLEEQRNSLIINPKGIPPYTIMVF